MFGWEVIENGDAMRADGRFFNDMRRDREIEDNEHDPLMLNIADVFERTETFVSDMEYLL